MLDRFAHRDWAKTNAQIRQGNKPMAKFRAHGRGSPIPGFEGCSRKSGRGRRAPLGLVPGKSDSGPNHPRLRPSSVEFRARRRHSSLGSVRGKQYRSNH